VPSLQRSRSSSSLVSDTRSICSVQDSETEVMEVHLSSSDFLHFSRRSDTLQEVRWFWVLEAVVADTTQLSDTRFTAVTGLCTYRHMNGCHRIVIVEMSLNYS
jgi:hypothetical protein